MALWGIDVDYDDNLADITVDIAVIGPNAGFDIRVLFDDTTPQDIIVDALQRAKERIADSVD